MDTATERARILQALVNRLRDAGRNEFLLKVVEVGGRADDEELKELHEAVDGIVVGDIVKRDDGPVDEKIHGPGVLYFSDWWERWRDMEKLRVKSGANATESMYSHVKERIGRVRLSSVTKAHVHAIRDDLRKKVVAGTIVEGRAEKVWNSLRACLDAGLGEQSPMLGVGRINGGRQRDTSQADNHAAHYLRFLEEENAKLRARIEVLEGHRKQNMGQSSAAAENR